MTDTITVTVSLRSILAKYRPDPKDRQPFHLELEAGATVADVLAERGVPIKLAHLVFVDKTRADQDATLHDGAELEVYPPIAGG
jgi:molybdopterin converting factor small subunit